MLGKYIMVNKIFRPHTIQGRVITNKMKGSGMGSVLLGTTGVGSSYTSMDDYLRTTQKGKSMGLGLGGAIQRKLESLAVKPAEQKYAKRKKNIQFDL
jgi:hypothetical protein